MLNSNSEAIWEWLGELKMAMSPSWHCCGSGFEFWLHLRVI